MLAEISFYNFVLFIHVTAVVLAFGVTFTYPVVFTIAHERLFSQVRTASLALNALMLIAIFLMVAKPGA